MKPQPIALGVVHELTIFVRKGSCVLRGPDFVFETDPCELLGHLPPPLRGAFEADENNAHRHIIATTT